MDFFEHQEAARRRTAVLVVCYALAVAGIVGVVYLAVAWLFTAAGGDDPAVRPGLWQPRLFAGVAAGVLLVVLIGTLARLAQLSRQGGVAVARALGGRPLPLRPDDPREQRLLNVVEEISLAAGVAMPRVFVLDAEPAINAFAAGFSARDAVIGVTRGAVETLSRDELQGVIAHEFSHIVNGDMRLNLRLMGVLFGIISLTVLGRVLLRTARYGGRRRGSGDGDRKEGVNPLPLLGLVLIIVGYIGVFFANLIKSAVSRQREYLSDASAVQYTRNPDGLANALMRIAQRGSRLVSPRAEEASHLFFGDALARRLGGLFATHPPLERRIARLTGGRVPHLPAAAAAPVFPPAPPVLPAAGFAAAAGTVDLAAGRALLRRRPAPLLEAARDPVGARALVYGLLMSPEARVRAAQRRLSALDPAADERLAGLAPALAALDADSRLPLVELALPALRTLDAAGRALFLKVTKGMIEADDRLDHFDQALQQMVRRQLDPSFGRAAAAPVRHRRLAPLLGDCALVLAAMARRGSRDRAAAEAAFRAGMSCLAPRLPPPPASVPPEDVERALQRLARAAPRLKRRFLDACAACVAADGQVLPAEAGLLRAVADALDVPVPPLCSRLAEA